MPLLGPPLNIAHVCITTCHAPANKTFGLRTSIVSPEHPVFSSTNSTCFHVLPPSVVRNTPRSCCGPVARPSAQTKTMFGLVGCTTMRWMRPVSARPMLIHVVPESLDLYTPSPCRSASRMAHASPVPAQTIDGLDGATASAPIACTRMLSKTGRNVAPLSTDFHTPPEAAPKYQTRASPGTPEIAEMRPPSAGPIDWKRNGSGCGGRGEGCVAPRCCAESMEVVRISVAASSECARRIEESPVE